MEGLSIPGSFLEVPTHFLLFNCLCAFLFFSLFYFFVVCKFLKIVSAIFDADQMTLCLSTLETAQYVVVNSCIYF